MGVKMSGFFNPDNTIFTTLGKLVDLIIISVIWILVCIPVITIGPASAALYYSVVKVIRRERGYLSREFFRSFKTNFKMGAIAGAIIMAMSVILYIDRLFAVSHGGTVGFILLGIFNAMAVIVILTSLYLFPVLSRFNTGLKQLFKTAVFLALRHLPTTILLAVIAAAVLISIYLLPIVIIVAPAIYTLLSSFLLERVFKKYMPEKSEDTEESAIDEWYLE
jgi:uncharacterized membrane protein YesL